jgi:hypothetical protein
VFLKKMLFIAKGDIIDNEKQSPENCLNENISSPCPNNEFSSN